MTAPRFTVSPVLASRRSGNGYADGKPVLARYVVLTSAAGTRSRILLSDDADEAEAERASILAELPELEPEIVQGAATVAPPEPARGALPPRRRADCAGAARPCPWTRCRYHMGRDGPSNACVLDLADRGDMTLEEIGDVLGVTRERVRQIEGKALDRCERAGTVLAEVAL